MITLLKSEPSDNPNEANLRIPTLEALLTPLRADNTNVMKAYTQVSNARINRDNILYKEKTGIIDTAQEVRAYVKSVFSASSDQYL